MEEGKGQGCLASSRQYGNALLGVRHQEEEEGAITALAFRKLKQITIKESLGEHRAVSL